MRLKAFIGFASLTLLMGPAHSDDVLKRCIICHGIDGHGATLRIPIVAGQKVAYLRQQLRYFRDSRRRHSRMNAQSKHLNDTDIDRVAAYFAARPCRRPALPNETKAAAPLVRPCLQCHVGSDRAGLETVPHLAGQKVGYLVRQIALFREAMFLPDNVSVDYRPHPVMSRIVKDLSSGEILTIANYFSRLGCGVGSRRTDRSAQDDPHIQQQTLAAITVNLMQLAKLSLTRATRAVVIVKSGRLIGSGFFVDPEGYLVTSAHLVNAKLGATVEIRSGERMRADFIAASSKYDLALLKVNTAANT